VRAGAFIFLFSLSAAAAPFTWTGAAGGGLWEDAGNWLPAAPPDDGTADVIFAAGGVVALDGVRVLSSISVSTAADVTLQPGSQPQSLLVLRAGTVFRGTRGRLIAQVPISSQVPVSFAGFEPQILLAGATVFDLSNASWAGATSVSQAILRASGDVVPAASALALGTGSLLDLRGRTVSIGSLSGSGSVINTSAAKATLFVGADGSDTTFSGSLGGALTDQFTNGFVDLVKVGPGTLTASGQLRLGGASFGLIGVLDGTLVITGAVSGANPVVVIDASSSRHGTLAGTGTVGLLWTANSSVPGATVRPGLPASKGILHAGDCDLRHGTLALRLSAYGTPGTDFDQLDCSGGSLSFDGDSDVVIDLGGIAATGGPVPIALYSAGNGPTAALQASQVHLINNPAGLVPTLTVGTQSLTLTTRAAGSTSAPLFVVTPGHGLITSERGRTATFTVALGKAPTGNVSMPVASSNPGEGTVSPASLAFTTQNWSTPQTVTVTGVNDSSPDGNIQYQINLGPCTSPDRAFRGFSPAAVSAVNLDDDLITVSPASGLVSQPFAPARFTLTFHAPVSGSQDVFIQFRSSDPVSASPSPAMTHLVVNNATPPPQTVTLAGAHRLQPGCVPYVVSAFAVLSQDPRYNGFELPDVSACNQGDRAPTATDVSFAIDQGSSLIIPAPGLGALAFDPDGDPLVASLAGGPAHGSVNVAADGTLTYTPVRGFSGTDSFLYSADDSAAAAAGAVQIAVNDVAPVAAADAFAVDAASGLLSVPAPGVLGNDSDAGGDALAARLASAPQHGTVTLNASGAFTYMPDRDFTGDDAFTYVADDGTLSSAPAQVTIAVTGAALESARMELTAEGGDTPGSLRTLHARITNTGSDPLLGASLVLGPLGMELIAAAAPSGALQIAGSSLPVPPLAPGESSQVDIEARLTALPGAQAGATAELRSASGAPLASPQQSFVVVSRLRFDAGGCGCHGSNPGGALAWLGALAVIWRRRRRSVLPGRIDLHLRHRLVSRDLALGGLAAAERIDGDHRDLLRPVAQANVGVELARGRHLHRLALHVDAAAGGDAAHQRDGAAVGLVAGPAHGEEHLLQGRRGLLETVAALHARHLAGVHLHGLSGGSHLHRAAGGGHHRGLALRGDEKVSARAVRHGGGVVDLEGDAAPARLDVGLHPAADAGAQQALAGGGHADLAAVVQLDAHAVHGELGLAVCGRAQAVALADALAGGGGAPGSGAALQLHGAAAADQHGAALGQRRRRLCPRRRGGRRSLFVAPARRTKDGEGDRKCCGEPHALPYRGVGGFLAIMSWCKP